jgi:hypothetical protein
MSISGRIPQHAQFCGRCMNHDLPRFPVAPISCKEGRGKGKVRQVNKPLVDTGLCDLTYKSDIVCVGGGHPLGALFGLSSFRTVLGQVQGAYSFTATTRGVYAHRRVDCGFPSPLGACTSANQTRTANPPCQPTGRAWLLWSKSPPRRLSVLLSTRRAW